MLFLALAAYLFAINLIAYLAFWADKRFAVRQAWRIPERTLLSFAFIGGWPGAKAGQRHFRHKTRKQPFASDLNAIPAIWCVLAVIGIGLSFVPPEWIDALLGDEPSHQTVRRTLPQVGF